MDHTVVGRRRDQTVEIPAFALTPSMGPADNLDLIEQQFASLKALLRKTTARPVGTLWAAIGARPGSFRPDACASYCRHAGHGSTGAGSALIAEAWLVLRVTGMRVVNMPPLRNPQEY